MQNGSPRCSSVKPSSIRITPDGQPVLLDFGLARHAQDASDLTQSFLGTPLCASPEQFGGPSSSIDGRTDVYALGVTLYQGLTGKPPFTGTLEQLLHGDPPSPRRLVPSISRDLETVVLTALQRRPHFPLASFGRGGRRYVRGDYRGALTDCDRTIALLPRFAFAYNARRVTRLKLGQQDAAQADFTRAIALEPNLARAWLNRALLLAERQPTRARADFDRAIALDPRLAQGYYERGNLRRGQGDLDGALADYSHSIALDPRADALSNRGALRQLAVRCAS